MPLCQYALGTCGPRSSGPTMPASSSEFIRVTESCTGSALRGFQFRELCMQLANSIDGYDWCGFYRLEGDTLVLDAFVGEQTEHTLIPVGSGICGAAVAQGKNQIVHDVAQRDDYLACSLETKSEIVVLIRDNGTVIGQIDVDSRSVGTFSKADERFLEELAGLLADRWAEGPQP